MKIECFGSVESHEMMQDVRAELDDLHISYSCRGNCISAIYDGNEPGTIRAVQDIFESLVVHTISASS